MGLKAYRAKRDAGLTPEPVPTSSGPDADHSGNDQAGRGSTFVIQEHHATALHWDFRLERDGVLVSWAVPKGLPLDPKRNHLAKQTEDHPLGYATFAGTIPQGQYGGGRVTVWDHGSYDLEKWTDDEVKVVLHGTRVQGRYVLFRTRTAKSKPQDWMVHRMDGSPPGWTPLPLDLSPMRAVEGDLPLGPGWAYEAHWPGEQVLVAVDGGRLTFHDGRRRTGFADLGLQLGSRQVLLDAVALAGTPQLVLTDLLHVEGRSLLDLTYDQRRAALDDLGLQGPSWQVSAVFDDGPTLLTAAGDQDLLGVIAKRRDSAYSPGVESERWVAVGVTPPST